MCVQRGRLVAAACAATGLLAAVAWTTFAGVSHAAMAPPAKPASQRDGSLDSRGIEFHAQPDAVRPNAPSGDAPSGDAPAHPTDGDHAVGPAVAGAVEAPPTPSDEARQAASAPTPTPTPSPDAAPEQATSPQWRWPAKGRVTSEFGPRWGRRHDGIDIAAPHGTPIVAAAGGDVTAARTKGGYGLVVKVAHPDGTTTLYAHLSELSVAAGQTLDAGERLGAMGCSGSCTGTHVHFEVRRDGAASDPRHVLP